MTSSYRKLFPQIRDTLTFSKRTEDYSDRNFRKLYEEEFTKKMFCVSPLSYCTCQATPADPEPQSEPCSANVTPAQNKKSMFGAFKLKKSKSLQETVECGGYDNLTGGVNGTRPESSRDRLRKEKSHFHLLPLRFPKSRSNSSVVSGHNICGYMQLIRSFYSVR